MVVYRNNRRFIKIINYFKSYLFSLSIILEENR